jgi:hypothetical protein
MNSILGIKSFISTHKKAVIGATVALGSAIYISNNKSIKKAFQNLADVANNLIASFFEQGFEPEEVIDIEAEIRKKHEIIDKEFTKRKQEREAAAKIRAQERKAAAKIRDQERETEFQREIFEINREYNESITRLENRKDKDNWEIKQTPKLWAIYGKKVEKNCTDLNPLDFRNMSEIKRLTDPRLNPMCCQHAEILLTSDKFSYNETSFSTFDDIHSQWKKLPKFIHPDMFSGDKRILATLASQIARDAMEILQLCLSKHHFKDFETASRFQKIRFNTN